MKTFKFKAEAPVDVQTLKYIMLHQMQSVKVKDLYEGWDCEVTFETKLSIEQVKENMRLVEDSHVMIQTIQPIEKYTGERDYSLT